mgnify:FL=1
MRVTNYKNEPEMKTNPEECDFFDQKNIFSNLSEHWIAKHSGTEQMFFSVTCLNIKICTYADV